MPVAGAVRKLGGSHPAKTAVRTHGVVVGPPCLDDSSGRSQRGKQVFVQTLVAQATIERFHKATQLRLPRGDVVPLDAGVLTPGEDGMTQQPATLGYATAATFRFRVCTPGNRPLNGRPRCISFCIGGSLGFPPLLGRYKTCEFRIKT